MVQWHLPRRIPAISLGTLFDLTHSPLTKRPPLSTQVWQELALLCASSDDHANAAFCADQALQLSPWQARSHQVQGSVHAAAGRAAAAMESYDTALSLDPTDASTLLALGEMKRMLF